jgi:hypothetical protein
MSRSSYLVVCFLLAFPPKPCMQSASATRATRPTQSHPKGSVLKFSARKLPETYCIQIRKGDCFESLKIFFVVTLRPLFSYGYPDTMEVAVWVPATA